MHLHLLGYLQFFPQCLQSSVQATIILQEPPDFLLPVLPLQPLNTTYSNCFLKQETDLITHTHHPCILPCLPVVHG